jgi:signal transduction histidine kinase
MEAIALETLVWRIANEWRQVAQSADLTMKVIIDQRGLFVLGDERRLRWAIGNILDNAIKYTPAGGALSLEIKTEQGGKARLRVRDTGVGVDAAELPHIFTRFYRGTPRLTSGEALIVPGRGQGLSMTRDIFAAHGGTVEVRSKVGVGTAVYLALPTAAPGVTLDESAVSDDGETVLVQPRTVAAARE